MEAGRISVSRFQSTSFKFGYDFPKGWTYRKRDKMSSENEIAYRKAAEKTRKENGPDSDGIGGAGTQLAVHKVYTLINLLIASPPAIDSADSKSLPVVRVRAHQRMPAIRADEGDHARLLSQMDNNRVLVPATRVNIGGRYFVRIDVCQIDCIYHSNVATVCGDYIVGF